MDIEWCIYIIGTYIWQWQPDVVVLSDRPVGEMGEIRSGD
jgi:hypothetical protein